MKIYCIKETLSLYFSIQVGTSKFYLKKVKEGFINFFRFMYIVSFYFSGYTAFEGIEKLNFKQYGRTTM